MYGELTLGPRGGSGPVTRARRRTQSGISVLEAPIHVPLRLPVPERQSGHVAEGAVRDSLDAQSVATVDDEELGDPPGLDEVDSSDGDLCPPHPHRHRNRAPPPPVEADEDDELGDPPPLDSDDDLSPPPSTPRAPPRAPRRPPAAAPGGSSPPQPRKRDYAFKQFYDAVMGDHDDFKVSAEKLIPPFSYQVSTVRLFKSDHGKVPCVYASCRACKVEAGQRCPFAMRYTLRKIEDATIEFSQPFLTSSHTLIIEETKGEHCSSHFSE